ncbi:Enamine deaminase RidA, house cleaning of reactive enamine intermediates, YjgF/YER057c/UK114 family [Mycolicibacterium rutilum]|uniref:Enamine deaminase RidA, house cleaning of reactive enamine intermediates, YjgF/YER057c/UK114 family n=2 Tax=Mycolicibacterium rutilum TaxID=370526 RepID=A0A1H6IKC2_MYCRU|nr:Enamine deaminase RidA, house cleaning of reactive enamine intermediates, YjgF/YER057c/UK114 family [Mycolicibacterium rutilum]
MTVRYMPEVEGLSLFGDYSPVAVTDGVVAVAGQFGTDGTSPEEQVRGAFANVGKALAAAGLGFSDVIKFTTYLVGRETIPPFMSERKKVFAEIYPEGVYPPNTLLIVAGLVHEEFVVEIEAIARSKDA